MAAPIDTRKLKDQANELYLKGKLKDAANLLEQVVKVDKTDVKSWHKLGDVYKKANEKTKAIEAYTKAAAMYAQQGFLVNAISVNKMILELDPNHKEVQEALAALYAKKEGSGVGTGLGQVKGASLELLEQFKKKPKTAAAPTPTAPSSTTPITDSADASEMLERDAEEILAQIPRIPLFSHLTPEEFVRIIDQLQVKVYEPGNLIICEGDHGDSFYVITHGVATVTKKDPRGQAIAVAELGEGNFFGEFAFLADSDRRASVVAKTELEVLEFSRAKLDELIHEHPRVKEVMLQFYRERVMNTLLAISPLFQPFNEQEKQALIHKFEFSEVPANTVVIRENTEGNGLYLIMSGEVEVSKLGPDGKPVILAHLREGEFFGEMSLLLRQKTTATVRTTLKTSLFKLPKAIFNEVILTHPQILEVIADFSDQRRDHTKRVLAGAGSMAAQGIV